MHLSSLKSIPWVLCPKMPGNCLTKHNPENCKSANKLTIPRSPVMNAPKKFEFNSISGLFRNERKLLGQSEVWKLECDEKLIMTDESHNECNHERKWEVNRMSRLSGNVRKLLDQAEARSGRISMEYDHKLIVPGESYSSAPNLHELNYEISDIMTNTYLFVCLFLFVCFL